MEQATDGAETAAAAAIDGLVSLRSENLILICILFCLRAPGYGLTLWKLLSVRLINVLTYLLTFRVLFTSPQVSRNQTEMDERAES